jgi:1,2-phenylacetyl-CoA epoxidase PaaB subunit
MLNLIVEMSQKQRNYYRKQTQKSKKQHHQSSGIQYADDEAIAIEKIRDNYRYLRC